MAGTAYATPAAVNDGDGPADHDNATAAADQASGHGSDPSAGDEGDDADTGRIATVRGGYAFLIQSDGNLGAFSTQDRMQFVAMFAEYLGDVGKDPLRVNVAAMFALPDGPTGRMQVRVDAEPLAAELLQRYVAGGLLNYNFSLVSSSLSSDSSAAAAVASLVLITGVPGSWATATCTDCAWLDWAKTQNVSSNTTTQPPPVMVRDSASENASARGSKKGKTSWVMALGVSSMTASIFIGERERHLVKAKHFSRLLVCLHQRPFRLLLCHRAFVLVVAVLLMTCWCWCWDLMCGAGIGYMIWRFHKDGYDLQPEHGMGVIESCKLELPHQLEELNLADLVGELDKQ
jgi:hypothetical protein